MRAYLEQGEKANRSFLCGLKKMGGDEGSDSTVARGEILT